MIFYQAIIIPKLCTTDTWSDEYMYQWAVPDEKTNTSYSGYFFCLRKNLEFQIKTEKWRGIPNQIFVK